jgi:hypothetical protein
MASILKVDTLTGVTTAGSISVTGEGNSTTTNLQQGLAKAWMDLNGSGTIALRDSNNIASVTDNTTGDYTASYTSAMSNANYSALNSCGVSSVITASVRQHTIAAGSYRLEMNETGGAAADSTYVHLGIHGDLA